jgi:molecular chaperone HtpG
MELRIPSKFKDVLDQNSALSGLVSTSLNEFGEWLRQNNVKFFAEYTDHSLEHVENVLQTAYDLIRDECKAFITPHDVATLILATLLHDSAMHISENGFATLVKEDFGSSIKGFGDKPWNRLWADFLAESRRFSGRKLIALFGDADSIRYPPLDDLQQLNGKDLLLCGEFLRRHHSRLAHEIALFGVPGPSGRILKLPATDDTSHVVDLAGLVARSHGLSLRDCFEYLQTHYSSVKMVRGIHPTFLMALLRIADILQIQSNRAPKQVLKVRQLKSPVSSGEWEMHQAIKDISSKEFPETIWVVARPDNVRTFLRIRNLLNQIQSELDLSWTVIGEVYGYDPQFREFGLKIRRIRSNIDDIDTFSKQVPYVPTHASFEAADSDLLKLLIGPLYGNKAEMGIRELIQNAVDAVHELHEYRKQFSGIQKSEISDLEGDIVVSISQENDRDWWLTVSDKGIGMTVNTIREYFLKAGASLRKSDLWKKTFEDEEGKSKVVRSGRFGVGALAAYLIGDEIKLSTRHIESPFEGGVEFVASLDTESIELRHVKRSVGTTISIKMNEQATMSLLRTSDDKPENIISKNYLWDWYCLDDLKVIRKIGDDILSQDSLLPRIKSTLPPGWKRIKHPSYEDIQWTYYHGKSNEIGWFSCNGIRVGTKNRSSHIRIRDNYISFNQPLVSVFDFNGNLPLNLERMQLTQRDFPFQEELLEDIIRDFIAFLIVETPSQAFPIHYRNWSKNLNYAGLNFDVQPLPWIFTNSGLGLSFDPWFLDKIGCKSLLVIPTYSDESLLPFHVSLEQVILGYYLNDSEPKLLELDQAIQSSIGFEPHDFINQYGYYQRSQLSDYIIAASRVIISKKLLQRLELTKEYIASQSEPLAYLDNLTNNKLISRNDFLQNIGAIMNKELSGELFSCEKEWEDQNWIIFKFGNCPESQFDFENFAKTQPEADYNKWPCIVGEWYLPDKQEYKLSKLAKAWRNLIGQPTIPYDLKERHRTLARAYKELKPYIDYYLARKSRSEERDLSKMQ